MHVVSSLKTGLVKQTHHGLTFKNERMKFPKAWRHCCWKLGLLSFESQWNITEAGSILWKEDGVWRFPWEMKYWRSYSLPIINIVIAIAIFSAVPCISSFTTERTGRRGLHRPAQQPYPVPVYVKVLGATWNTHFMSWHKVWPSHCSSRCIQRTATKVCLCLDIKLCRKLHLKISVIDFLFFVKKYD